MMIQTTHVGSLPRPAEMITRQLKKEEISEEDLSRYIGGIVERQISQGLTYVNNGELPRSDYLSATVQRISGLNDTCIAPLPQDLEELPEYSRRFSGRNGLITLNPKAPVRLPACSAELSYAGEDSLRKELDTITELFREKVEGSTGGPSGSATNLGQASDRASRRALFFTAPSPGTLALFLENRFYPDYRSYLEKLGEVLQHEYEVIRSYDVILQVDCPDLAMGRHTTHKRLEEEDFLKVADANIEVLNNALSNFDAGDCRAHICWGNYPGTHHCDIELKSILPAISKLRPRYISLESCNHRHSHEWELFNTEDFPEDKVLMPGVIDTNSNTVEHPELVAWRLRNFMSILGSERVIGSTDCGFASTSSATSVSGEVAWLKLGALVEGAQLAGRGV